MRPAWSGEQQRCLEALGLSLYGAVATGKPAQDDHGWLANALMRAAGTDPRIVADVDSWLRSRAVPALSLLRSDPRAKRELWPRLRALRAQDPQR